MRIEKYPFVLYTFLTIFWVACASGVVVDELLPFLAPHKNTFTLLSETGMFALGTLCLRKRSDIVWYLGIFGLAYFSTCIVNHNGAMRFLMGVRDFAGLLCVVPVLRWLSSHGPEGDFLRRFNRQLYIWLILQAVCITWQLIRYGAGDNGGGTAGDGASGNTSICIYMVSLFLLLQHWDADNFWQSLKANRKYVILLYPTFLNETKVSFIYFLLYFFFLLPFNRKFVARAAMLIPAAVIVLCGALWIYFSTAMYSSDQLGSGDFYEAYMYGDDLDRMMDHAMALREGDIDVEDITYFGDVDIPRVAKYLLIWPKLEDCPGGLSFGAGIGQFQGWNSDNFTKFAHQNQWLLYGTKPWGFSVITQIGIVGFILTTILIINNIWSRARGNRKVLKLSLLMLATFVMSLLYNDCWRVLWFDIIFFYVGFYIKQPQAAELPFKDS